MPDAHTLLLADPTVPGSAMATAGARQDDFFNGAACLEVECKGDYTVVVSAISNVGSASPSVPKSGTVERPQQ